ncbi:MAG: peptide-methionine (R)-S-oxide reductase MsrB [Chitinophagales bacterium]
MSKYKYTLSEEQWAQKLTPEQYRVLRKKGTERPFTGAYDKFFEEGVYVCAGCGQTLFTSESKYDSGCGWPAFDAPVTKNSVEYAKDNSHGMIRVEIVCASCGGHLGHVFNDGPATTTGMRYCVNSESLQFKKED